MRNYITKTLVGNKNRRQLRYLFRIERIWSNNRIKYVLDNKLKFLPMFLTKDRVFVVGIGQHTIKIGYLSEQLWSCLENYLNKNTVAPK